MPQHHKAGAKAPMGARTYEVWLYASRRLRNPNRMGEHDQSLRSLAWTGSAGTEDQAVEKAKRALGLALTALATLTGKILDPGPLRVDHIVNGPPSDGENASVELGEVVTEQLAKARKGKPSTQRDAFDVETVLEHALRCMLADGDASPASGTHILSACVEEADEPTERLVETSYAVLGHGDDADIERRARPDHVEVLQTLAATWRLTDKRADDDGRTEGAVSVPASATLRAAFHRGLREARPENGKMPAAFLRAFGCEAEALIFEGRED